MGVELGVTLPTWPEQYGRRTPCRITGGTSCAHSSNMLQAHMNKGYTHPRTASALAHNSNSDTYLTQVKATVKYIGVLITASFKD